MDLESLQARLKRTLFRLADAELAHICIHRLHGNNVTSQGIAPAERLKVAHDGRRDVHPHAASPDFSIGAAGANIAHPHQRLVRVDARGFHVLRDERATEILRHQGMPTFSSLGSGSGQFLRFETVGSPQRSTPGQPTGNGGSITSVPSTVKSRLLCVRIASKAARPVWARGAPAQSSHNTTPILSAEFTGRAMRLAIPGCDREAPPRG
jgi:hypothetical protein